MSDNPQVVIQRGDWTVIAETARFRIRTERNVHLSDNPFSHGKGTLLRIDKRTCRTESHTVTMHHAKGGGFILRLTNMGKRTSVTKLCLDERRDLDGKLLPNKPESYTMDKAEAFLVRALRLTPAKAQMLLTPLPDGDGPEVDAETITAALQEA